MRTHLEGGVQTVGAANCCEAAGDGEAVAVPVAVSVAVCSAGVDVNVGVGKLSGSVGGICVGVAWAGRFSARERTIPPRTKTTDTMAMITPPPNWRMAFITGSLYTINHRAHCTLSGVLREVHRENPLKISENSVI